MNWFIKKLRMEPQITDYYNEMPTGVNVIEKMNEEFNILQKENDELKKKLKINLKKKGMKFFVYILKLVLLLLEYQMMLNLLLNYVKNTK